MEVKDLRALSIESIQEELRLNQTKLQEFHFSLSANQMKNVREIRKVRQYIARLQTILEEKKNS